MKFKIFFFNEKAALHIAVEKGNIELIKILLSNPNIDINLYTILNIVFVYIIIINIFFISF